MIFIIQLPASSFLVLKKSSWTASARGGGGLCQTRLTKTTWCTLLPDDGCAGFARAFTTPPRVKVVLLAWFCCLVQISKIAIFSLLVILLYFLTTELFRQLNHLFQIKSIKQHV